MRDRHKKALIRLLVCYLIAAAVQTLVLAAGVGEPHTGAGPVVVGAILLFWAMPLLTAGESFSPSGLDALQTESMIYFAVVFTCCAVVAFRRKLERWRGS